MTETTTESNLGQAAAEVGDQSFAEFEPAELVRELNADFEKKIESGKSARKEVEYRPWEAKAAEEAEGRRFVAEKAIDEAARENATSEGWRESKSSVDLIKQMLPGHVSPKQAADMVLQYEALSRKDPEAGAEFLVRELALWGPKGSQPKARPESTGLREMLERSWEHAEDGEALQEFRNAYGPELGKVLAELPGLLEEAMKDPHAFAERRKYLYGAPRTALEQQELAQKSQQAEIDRQIEAESREVLERASEGIPLLKDDAFLGAVAETLGADWFKSQTGHIVDQGELLHVAYHVTLQVKAEAEARERQEALRKKASLSVTGTQSHGAGLNRPVPKTIREALTSAFEGVEV